MLVDSSFPFRCSGTSHSNPPLLAYIHCELPALGSKSHGRHNFKGSLGISLDCLKARAGRSQKPRSAQQHGGSVRHTHLDRIGKH